MDQYYRNIPTTMCDFEDFYIEKALSLPNNCVIAECGVADGYSSLLLADALHAMGKKYTLYMIDNMDYGKTNQLQTIINHVVKSQLPGIEVIPLSSLDASCKFPDGHFDFVFIDASHEYEPTKADIRLWYHKIKEGGLLAGHDYYCCPGVQQAVDEVIPVVFTRPTIYETNGKVQQKFQPEPCLWLHQTTQGWGVWSVEKKFYFKLN